MSFLNLEYFWLLLLLLPLFITKDYRDFRATFYGYIITFILIVIALSRPVIESQPIQSDEILSDVVIAVDLSYSMQANDIQPTRLGFAKETLVSLVDGDTKSRYGVLGFTTNAIILSPLTEDSALLKHLFNALDDKLIITKGSSVMPALKLARKMSASKSPSVVILSDGGDENDYELEASYAKENSLVVNIFMIATKFGSTLKLASGEFLKDELGDIVVTSANERISAISNATGGVYTENLDELRDALESQRNKDYKSKTTIVQNVELFYYIVVLAILTFLVSITTLKRYVIAFLLLFGITLNANSMTAFKEANRLYKKGEYEKALVKYESVRSSKWKIKSILYYNMANTLVRLKEFKKAREAYEKSLTLEYSQEADENLQYIKDVQEQMQMNTGQEKTDKKSSIAKKEESSSKKKESGGSSNMKVTANAGSGESKNDKKSASQNMLNMNEGKAKLSSKQYELINKRNPNEKKPY